MKKNSTLIKTVKKVNSSFAHDDIIELEFRSAGKTILAWIEYKIILEGVSTSSHSTLFTVIKDGRKAQKRYVI